MKKQILNIVFSITCFSLNAMPGPSQEEITKFLENKVHNFCLANQLDRDSQKREALQKLISIHLRDGEFRDFGPSIINDMIINLPREEGFEKYLTSAWCVLVDNLGGIQKKEFSQLFNPISFLYEFFLNEITYELTGYPNFSELSSDQGKEVAWRDWRISASLYQTFVNHNELPNNAKERMKLEEAYNKLNDKIHYEKTIHFLMREKLNSF